MLRCENHYFQIKKDYFCGLFDCAFTFLKEGSTMKTLPLDTLDDQPKGGVIQDST
jgi:hypothetical protein